MKTAFVLGGTGFVGRHVSRRLAEGGWDVTVGSKGETATPREVADLSRVTIDRSVKGTLLRDLFEGIDVLVDVIPYEIVDAEQLVALKDVVGSVIAISTTSVYADDDGRTLDEATGEEDTSLGCPSRSSRHSGELSRVTTPTRRRRPRSKTSC